MLVPLIARGDLGVLQVLHRSAEKPATEERLVSGSFQSFQCSFMLTTTKQIRAYQPLALNVQQSSGEQI